MLLLSNVILVLLVLVLFTRIKFREAKDHDDLKARYREEIDSVRESCNRNLQWQRERYEEKLQKADIALAAAIKANQLGAEILTKEQLEYVVSNKCLLDSAQKKQALLRLNFLN